jgi:hypothetical protein
MALRDKMNGVLKFFVTDEELLEERCVYNVSITGPTLTPPASLMGSAVTFTWRRQIPDSDPPIYQIVQRTAVMNASGQAIVEIPFGSTYAATISPIEYMVQMAKAPDGMLPDSTIQSITAMPAAASCPVTLPTFKYIDDPDYIP